MRLTWVSGSGAEGLEMGEVPEAVLAALRDDPAHHVRVVTADVVARTPGTELPPSPGAFTVAGSAVTFVPRFPFMAGRTYVVVVDGEVLGQLDRAPAPPGEQTTVVAVHPSGSQLPRNALRLYLHFSAPMAEGHALGGVRVTEDANDSAVEAVFMPTPQELWDPTGRRLTLFLDPARIKQGLVPHEEMGYPLQPGATIRLVVDGMLDAAGQSVRPHVVRWEVVADLRHRLLPSAWAITSPAAGTPEPLVVAFDRPLDHGLLQQSLRLDVAGTADIGPGETSWRFVPDRPWPAGEHHLRVAGILEDVAGNSVRRAFDRDLGEPADAPLDVADVVLSFSIA